MVSSCSRDPFAGAPALPAAAERVEWWAARVRGKTVGIEERAFGEGEIVARRASFSFASAGERSNVYKASLVRCDPSGCGVTEDSGLPHAYASARTLRLADGPDEVHRNQIGKLELARHKAKGAA